MVYFGAIIISGNILKGYNDSCHFCCTLHHLQNYDYLWYFSTQNVLVFSNYRDFFALEVGMNVNV